MAPQKPARNTVAGAIDTMRTPTAKFEWPDEIDTLPVESEAEAAHKIAQSLWVELDPKTARLIDLLLVAETANLTVELNKINSELRRSNYQTSKPGRNGKTISQPSPLLTASQQLASRRAKLMTSLNVVAREDARTAASRRNARVAVKNTRDDIDADEGGLLAS